MKKIIYPALFLLLFLLCSTANANLIENGTFDTDLSGWEITEPVSWVDGKAHIGRPGPNIDSAMEQYFDISTGTTALTISFEYLWFGNDSTEYDDVFTASFSYLDTSSQWNTTQLVNENNNESIFSTTIYFDQSVILSTLSSDSPNGHLKFALTEQYSEETQGTRIELDNVAVAPVPEPATMMLFGIGLLGLAGVSRRKK